MPGVIVIIIISLVRECGEDYKCKGRTIPKGCSVMFPTYLLHMDPEYWKDSEIFDPLRCVHVYVQELCIQLG